MNTYNINPAIPAFLQLNELITNLNNKKGNKNNIFQDIFNLVQELGTEGEKYCLNALLESIDLNQSKDKLSNSHKTEIFKKLLTELSLQTQNSQIIDYLSSVIDKSYQFSIQIKKSATGNTEQQQTFVNYVKQMMKQLDLNVVLQLIIALSLIQSTNQKIQKDGITLFKFKLKDYFDLDQPQVFPDYITSNLLNTIQTHQELKVPELQEQVQYLVQSNIQNKSYEFRPLMNKYDNNFPKDNKFQPLPAQSLITPLDLIKELGPTCTQSEQQIQSVFNGYQISEETIIKCIIYMFENTNDSEDNQQRIINSLYNVEQKNSQEEWNKITNDDNTSADKKNNVSWNFKAFVQYCNNNIQNLDWEKVMKKMDTSDFNMEKQSQLNMLQFFLSLKDQYNFNWPSSLFTQKWQNQDSQIKFLQNLFQLEQPDLIGWKFVNKRIMTFDHQPTIKYHQLNPEIMQLWVCLDILELLIELSDGNHLVVIREMFEFPIAKFPEHLLVGLSQVKVKKGNQLLDEIYSQLFPVYLGNHANSIPILESVWKNNEELLISAICELYKRENKKENTCLNLSRVLDITQNIPDSLVKLAKWNDYNFSVNLGILAGKREFLHFDNWLKERLRNIGDPFITALLTYIEENVISQIRQLNLTQNIQSFNQDQMYKQYDNILEKSQLSLQLLSITFEQLTLYDHEQLSTQNQIRLVEDQKIIKEFFPNFQSQPDSSQETEQIANMYFQKIYQQQISIQDTIIMLKKFDQNPIGSQDQEVLACMLTGLLDEYRFHEQYPDKELSLTGQLFGEIITHQLFRGRALIIALDSVLKSIQDSKIKRLDFGIQSLKSMQSVLPKLEEYLEQLLNVLSQPNAPLVEKYPRDVYQILYNLQQQGVQNPKIQEIQIIAQQKLKQSQISVNNNIQLNSALNQQQIMSRRQESPIKINNIQQQPNLNQNNSININNTQNNNFMQQMNPQLNPDNLNQQQSAQQFQRTQLANQTSANGKINLDNRSHSSGYLQTQNNLQQQVEQKLLQQQKEQILQRDQSKIPKSLRNQLYVDNNYFNNITIQELLSKLLEKVENQNVKEETRNFITFHMNNLTQKNLDEKVPQIREKLNDPQVQLWFAKILCYKRVFLDTNQQNLYKTLLIKIKNKYLMKQVIKISLKLLKYVLLVDKQPTQYEKNIMKNLGSWIGLITLSRNKPILSKYLNMKNLIIDAFPGKIAKILPIMTKIFEQSKGTCFTIESPWLKPIINVLAEVRISSAIQLAQQVEIILLFNNLDIKQHENIKILNYLEKRKLQQNQCYGITNQQINNTEQIPKMISDNLQQQQIKNIQFQQNMQQQQQIPQQYLQQQQQYMNQQQQQQIPQQTPYINYENAELMISSLTQYIYIDSKFFKFTQQGLQLVKLVAYAVDVSIQEIIPPVIQRSCTIALITTKELALKDYGLEPDPKKILKGAQLMIQKLSGSLALVTSREPLRTSLQSNIKKLLEQKNDLQILLRPDEIDDIVSTCSNDNLDVGCSFVRKVVCEKALEEVVADQTIIETLEKRKNAQEKDEPYIDLKYTAQVEFLPDELKPKIGGLNQKDLEIYDDFRRTVKFNNQEDYNGNDQQFTQGEALDNYKQDVLQKFNNFLKLVVQYINKNDQVSIQNSVVQTYEFFNQIKNVESLTNDIIRNICLQICLQRNAGSIEDRLQVFCEFIQNLKQTPSVKYIMISQAIQEFFLNFETKQQQILNEYFHIIVKAFLIKDFISINHYQDILIHLLKVNNNDVTVYRRVIDMIKSQQPQYYLNLKEVFEILKDAQCIKNNAQDQEFIQLAFKYMNQPLNSTNNQSQNKTQKIPMEQELQNIIKVTNQYFNNLDQEFCVIAKESLEEWLSLITEQQISKYVKKLETEILPKGDDNIHKFFIYVNDICLTYAMDSIYNQDQQLNEFQNMDLSYIDQISKQIIILLKALKNMNKCELLDRICYSILIVLTKWHESQDIPFNQRPFFKLFMNLIYDIGRVEYGFSEKEELLTVLAKYFLILKPSNYPGFAFSWLELISHRYFAPLLLAKQENWFVYHKLVLSLFQFFKNVINEDIFKNEFMKTFYKGSLRYLLVLLHDYPDFLSEYAYVFCEELPLQFRQVRNFIFASFPKELKPPDPFQIQMIEHIEEFKNYPKFHYPDLETISIKYNIVDDVLRFCAQKNNDTYQVVFSKLYQLQNNQYLPKVKVIHTFILQIATLQINNQITKDDAFLILSQILKNSNHPMRQELLNSMANHLRFPNSITGFYIQFLLQQFLDFDDFRVLDQITRILLERLIAKRPHPWGLVYLLLELCKNKKYKFKERPFVLTQEMEQIFKQVFKSIYPADTSKNTQQNANTNNSQIQ